MSDGLQVAAVTPERWTDLADLFERKGPRGGSPMPAGCWCMWWRQRTGAAERNREAMRALVADGREPGLLAYEDGRAVGWASVAPREEFGQLVRSRQYGPNDGESGVWSIVCFYVDPRAKRTGVAGELLDAAIKFARDRGASVVEAYPNRRGDYMGRLEAFERRGFRRTRDAGKRVVVRLSL